MSKRVTIVEVAKKAGVSKVTVSYVLNGESDRARISKGTEQKVVSAARDLGYRPHRIARMLVTKRSETLGVVFQFAEYFATWSSFISGVMHGVCEAAVARGYDLMLHTGSASDPDSEADALSDGRVDGVLMLRDSDDPVLADLLRRQFPCVLFFSRSEEKNIAFVDSDNRAGGRMATEHLIALGHRRIAMVRGSAHSASSNARFEGYGEALEASGIPIDPRLVLEMASPAADASGFVTALRSSERPTALFAWSDDVAFECHRIARGLGLSVPRDLSIVGFDSSDACAHSEPPLTSVRQPLKDMAQDAVNILVGLIQKGPVENRQIIYPPSLDVRGSTSKMVES